MEDDPIDPLELAVQESLGTMTQSDIFLERVKQEAPRLPRYKSFEDGVAYAKQVDTVLKHVKQIAEDIAKGEVVVNGARFTNAIGEVVVNGARFTNAIGFTWAARLQEDWSGGGFNDGSYIDIDALYRIINLDPLLIPGLVSLGVMNEFETTSDT